MLSEIKNKKLFSILKWLFFLFIMYVLQFACISNSIRPFYFVFLFVLIWCNQNILLVSLFYLLSCYLYNQSIDALVVSIISVGVVLFFYWLHYKLRKPLNITLLCIYAFFSQLYYYYVRAITLQDFTAIILEFSLGIIFMLASLTFFQSLIIKKKGQILSIEQMIGGAVFLAVFSLGLQDFSFYGFELLSIFTIFLIFLFSKQKPTFASLIIAVTIGIGTMLSSLDSTHLVLYTCYALFVSIFIDYNKYLSFFSLLAVDLFLCLYLNVATWSIQSFLCLFLGFALFLSLENKLTTKIGQYFFINPDKNNLKSIVNRNREYQYKQLLEISQVFNEMDKVFHSMAKGTLPEKEAKQMLVQELSQNVCKDCLDRSRCLRLSTKETLDIFSHLIGVALQKGKITLIDIPNSLSQKCTRVNILIATVNNMITQYKQYSSMQASIDTSKLLIGQQLGGVAKIMQELAVKLNENVEFDNKKEKDILEELNYNNIDCNEAIVFKSQNNEVSTCLLIVNNEHLFAKTIAKLVSKILKVQVSVVSIEDSSIKGYCNVFLKSTPKYDLIFGSSQKAKAGTSHSGDTHSFLRIGDDKVMFALSDGMGSGESAYKTSSTAISLIENFYKAGFDNETILSSVNKLLTISSTEVFSAIDICVVDLRLGIADIIKIGAPIGFIKHQFETQVLDGGSLPLGILEEVKPNITKHAIAHGDNIILVSDGVVDSFESEEQLFNFVNNLQTLNPQTMAEEILSQAIDNDKQSPNDDMTVVVGRIINNI